MRWGEEVILTTYEMQWSVRYFIHKSKFWAENNTLPGISVDQLDPINLNFSGAENNAGALAYAKRKQSIWYQLALKADRTFKTINNAYKSPL